MKMAGLCWMTVALVFFLSAGDSVTAVNRDDLAKIVKFMVDRYQINNQVSVAVNTPVNQDLNRLDEFFATASDVTETLAQNSVFVDDSKMVAAKPYKNVHAEVRVLKNMNNLINMKDGKYLVFYSFYSPCDGHCMNPKSPYTIIPKINEIIPNWSEHVFVFSKVFDRTSSGTPIPREKTIEALNQLGNSAVGRNNVYRCYKPQNQDYQCINCFNGASYVEECVVN
ncbi:uncharacterized protein AKAME5_001947300 [Lates japonicus]|uniref:Uncharacterized protein n=1 Tax=Lates japonicus TaxID=270547 RepID=A0AAD3RHI1_LATJO|nr:uncharacterized protein AKAME5_001947300 [Lates japonicus]